MQSSTKLSPNESGGNICDNTAGCPSIVVSTLIFSSFVESLPLGMGLNKLKLISTFPSLCYISSD